MRILLIDDEPFAIRRLTLALKNTPEVEIVGTAANGDAALIEIRRLKPDLVILDVQMPGLSGLSVAAALEEQDGPEIIFLTAFDRYATEAFSVEATDYLLKPLKPERLEQALQRARRRIAEKALIRSAAGSPASIEPGPPAQGPGLALPVLHIPDRRGGQDLPQSDIVWIEAAKDYALVHTRSRTFILRTTMAELAAQLQPSIVRVHRSAFVALDAVHHWLRSSRGFLTLVLEDGVAVQVGPSYAQTVRSALQRPI
jgi:DNA-binding LytR/AlgR family response regulator